MIRSRFISAAVLTAVLAGVGASLVTPMQPAMAADKGNTVRPEIGNPIKAARDLIAAKRFKEALAQLQTAEAVGSKTPFESYAIEATQESAYLGAGDYANAVKTAEALIVSGQLGPADQVNQLSVIAKLDYQLKDYAKFLDAANRYYKAGGTDDSFHLLMAQAYYQMNDLPNAAKILRGIVAAQAKPPEDQLVLLMSIEYKQNPTSQGYIDALTKLAATYPKKNYWHDLLLIIQKKPGFSDRLHLDIARLKIATGVMDNPDDFMDAAQVAIQQGQIGDAKAFMDKGYASGVLGQGAEAARQKRLADLVNTQAASDVKTLGQEAAQAHGGTELLKLGDAYAGYAQYDQAIAAYQKAISTGGFKNPTDANMAKLHLGIAYISSGQKPKGKDALKSVTGTDGTADVAQIWLLMNP